MTFKIKRNDRRPSMPISFTPPDGQTLDLTQVGTVARVIARKVGAGSVQFKTICVITGPKSVRYDWAAGDTATSGTYDIEVG